MAGVGGLVDQNMPQGLRGFHGGGGQVDGGVKQAEQTGGGQTPPSDTPDRGSFPPGKVSGSGGDEA